MGGGDGAAGIDLRPNIVLPRTATVMSSLGGNRASLPAGWFRPGRTSSARTKLSVSGKSLGSLLKPPGLLPSRCGNPKDRYLRTPFTKNSELRRGSTLGVFPGTRRSDPALPSVEYFRPGRTIASDLTQAVRSLSVLRRLEVEILFPAHGPPVGRDVSGQLDALIARAPRGFLGSPP